MLFLVFSAGEDRYAIDASQTVEILPLIHWKKVPGAPAPVAGVFNYHGTPVPLLDLAELMTGKPSRSWMSTRIIVVKWSADSRDVITLLGLLAEQVTETLRESEENFWQSKEAGGNSSYLGGIVVQPAGMIQRIRIEHLLPADLHSRLFLEQAGAV